jgi:hypothetical protein
VEIERARQRRWTGAVIAEAVGLSRATMARTLRGLGRTLGPAHRAALAPSLPVARPLARPRTGADRHLTRRPMTIPRAPGRRISALPPP